jgi:hypothetical protein
MDTTLNLLVDYCIKTFILLMAAQMPKEKWYNINYIIIAQSALYWAQKSIHCCQLIWGRAIPSKRNTATKGIPNTYKLLD